MVVGTLSAMLLLVASIAGVLWGARFIVALAREKTASEAFEESNNLLAAIVGAIAALLVMTLTYSAEIIDVGTQIVAQNAMGVSNAIIGTLGYVGLAGIVRLDPVHYLAIAAAVIVAVAFVREARSA